MLTSGSVIQGYFANGLPRIPHQPPAGAASSRPQWVQQCIDSRGGAQVPPQIQPLRAAPHAPHVHGLANGTATRLPQNLMNMPRQAGRPLPADVRQRMESLFGASFGAVRVHIGPEAAAIGAFAFTSGADIHFAPGHYDPATHRGRQILGHELAHVQQQRSGRVRNPFGSGVALIHDAILEGEADGMGARAAIVLTPSAGARPVQRLPAPGHRGRSRVIQRHPVTSVQVNGTTTLRESAGGRSLAEGRDFAAVTGKSRIFIDKGDVWESRLGKSPWYRVLEYDGADLSDRDIYLCGGTFNETRQLTKSVITCPFKGPVRTFGGTWQALEYYAKPGIHDLSARGLHILLQFTPQYPADATEIALVQTVCAYKNDDFYYINRTIKSRSWTGTSIDQREDSISPAYASIPQDPSTIAKDAGQHGYRYFDGKLWQVQAAQLQDNPHLRGVESFSGQSFETTALALKGRDAGTYYGSVKWGWFATTGGDPELIPLQVDSYGSASAVFDMSVHAWNTTTTSEGAKPIPLPKVPRLEL